MRDEDRTAVIIEGIALHGIDDSVDRNLIVDDIYEIVVPVFENKIRDIPVIELEILVCAEARAAFDLFGFNRVDVVHRSDSGNRGCEKHCRAGICYIDKTKYCC